MLPGAAAVSAGQGRQSVLPVLGWYVFAGQTRHSALPEAGW